jgi:hypothetical protein
MLQVLDAMAVCECGCRLFCKVQEFMAMPCEEQFSKEPLGFVPYAPKHIKCAACGAVWDTSGERMELSKCEEVL